MNSTNGSETPVGTQRGPATGSHHSAPLNGHDTRHAEEPPVIDATLDERDVRVQITLNLHGRTTRLKEIKLDRTVFESLDIQNRWILLKGIEDTVAELRRILAHKLKKNFGLEEDSSTTKDSTPGDLPAELAIHHPPGVSGGSW